MTQRFTYFKPDGTTEIRTQPNAPLPTTGEVYVRGTYEPPDFPSPLNVRVGRAGIKVWMVIRWLEELDDDLQRVLAAYGGVLEPEDLEAARGYYRLRPEEIRARIDAEFQAV